MINFPQYLSTMFHVYEVLTFQIVYFLMCQVISEHKMSTKN